ncbi:hypothetical protein ACFCX0_32175 [Streptomyces sp. NPDC056352]|uniref:hypothetical protein n=1 Tax=Streptomyces sp. NPDC056352 TaxID=3345791 RepID=UPI0035DA841C
MPSSFDASANDVLEATKMLRAFTTYVDSVVQRFDDGVNDTITWYGTGTDDFATQEGPVYLKTVKITRETVLAITDALTALANGTTDNANGFLDHQDDVISSIKNEHNGQSGPRG